MLPRAVFEQAGGFDEAFNPVEYEDLDLCYRVREFGHRALVEPAVEMYHFESVTTAGTPALPNTRLIIEHGLLFKRRWRHRFSRENGPPDSETAWRKLPPVDLEAVGSLPLLG
jgi:GT2 family glycosyltransferase